MKMIIHLVASLVAFGALVGREEGAQWDDPRLEGLKLVDDAIEFGRIFVATWRSPGRGSVARAARQEVEYRSRRLPDDDGDPDGVR